MDAVGQAEKELGAVIRVIRRTSTEYALENDPPPCPSVLVNGKIVARNETVTYQSLKAFLLNNSDAEVMR